MALKSVTPPLGLFRGQNLMTPKWLGFFELREGYAELSSGSGMDGAPIFGVTVRGTNEIPSQLFYSRKDAEDYIEENS